MRPTQELGELIAIHMSTPGDVLEPDACADFAISALRAAGASEVTARKKIVSQVANLLNCRPEELDFMFSEFSWPVVGPANYEVMLPDFQTQLMAVAE